jgi:serine/threonine protein kinase
MNKIDIDSLNNFLADSNIPYQAFQKLPASGQRDVYLSECLVDRKQYIVKVAHYNKYNVARIEREIKILNQINSSYFPSVIFETFVSKTTLEQYYENIFTAEIAMGQHAEAKAKIEYFQKNPLQPFYLTVENYIENLPWNIFWTSATESTVLNFIRHCFIGLDLLWTHNIAHRDLKPANLLVRPDQTPVIIDLGIAKSFNDGTVDLTPGFLDTPHTFRYGSPEQLLNRKADINYKSDQYSMGIVAYQLLCNKFPFGDMVDIGPDQVIQNMLQFNYTTVSDAGGHCCDAFEALIKKLLQPEPHQRFRTTKKLFQQIDNIYGALQ